MSGNENRKVRVERVCKIKSSQNNFFLIHFPNQCDSISLAAILHCCILNCLNLLCFAFSCIHFILLHYASA